MPDRNITFEIMEHLGVIAKRDKGWSKELNIISWNGQAPKFDIRDWDEHHERMSRGVTLYPDEMRRMVNLYFANNSRKAVESGKALEEERRQRREAERRVSAPTTSDKALEEVEAAALEGATQPSSEEEFSRADLPEESTQDVDFPEDVEPEEGDDTPF